MTLNSAFDLLQENASKPRFCKSLSLGETWKSKSKRIIPEEFVRRTNGAFKHRLVFSVSWGNSWQVWLQRDENGLFMEEEDWDEFVDDNLLDPNDILIFTHVHTMFTEVRIYKKDSRFFKQVISSPLLAAEVLSPKPQTFRQDTPSSASPGFASASASASRARQSCSSVQNPEQYLLNPQNPYFVKTLSKKIDVLYVNQDVIQKYGLKFGPHLSPVHYLLPREKHEAVLKIYRNNTPCFNRWAAICKKYDKKEGDSVVCELERDSRGVVTAVRVHFVNE